MEILINVALWILWGLPTFIVGLIFAFRGAKRGTVPALISVGATLVSGIFSWLIAHLIGGFVASGLAKFFNTAENIVEIAGGNLPFDLSAVSASANFVKLIDCLLKSVCTVAVFGLLMFVNSIIIKNIVSSIVTKKVTFPAKFSWGGFFISLFDAILLVSLIMLPTYGPAALVRDVQPLTQIAWEQDQNDDEDSLTVSGESDTEDILALMETVAKHPLIVAYDAQPMAFVFDSLCSSSFNGASFSPSALVRNSCDMAQKVAPLYTATEVTFDKDSRAFATAFIKWMDGNKALKPLVLDVYNSIIGAADLSKQVGQEGDEDSQKTVALLKSFQEVITNLMTVDTTAKRNERLDSVEMLTIGAIRLLKNTDSADSSDLNAMIPMFSALGDMLEGVARHPAIGVDGVMNVYSSLITNLGLGDSAAFLTQESTIESIRNTLTTALTKDVKDEFTATFFATLMETAASFSGTEEIDMTKLLTADPAVLDSIKSMVSTDTLKSFGLDDESAEKASGIVSALVDTIKTCDLTEEEAQKEGEILGSVMNAVMNDGEISKELQDDLKNSKIVNALAESTELDAETRKMIQDFLK